MSIPYEPYWETEELLAMPFDQYQRYRLAAELLAALKQAAGAGQDRWQVLDVGGYYQNITGESRLPMADFARDDDLLVVDVVDYEHPQYRQASGMELPFPEGSFDVVISCDTLEHIPFDSRSRFLCELRRVSRRATIVIAPHAMPGVELAERSLDEYLRSVGGGSEMLEEHLRYGLPQPSWVETWLEEQQAQYVTFPSGYLPRWHLLMLLKHLLFKLSETNELHRYFDQTYNRRFFEYDQRAPGYRRAYVMSSSLELLAAIQPFVERTTRQGPEDQSAILQGLALSSLTRAMTPLLDLPGSYSAMEQHFQHLVQAYGGVEELRKSQATLEDHFQDLVQAYGGVEELRKGQAALEDNFRQLVLAYGGLEELRKSQAALEDHFRQLVQAYGGVEELRKSQEELRKSHEELHKSQATLEQDVQQLVQAYGRLDDSLESTLETKAVGIKAQIGQLSQTVLTKYQTEMQVAARMEAEKQALQQQLEMLQWQNELLHQRLRTPSQRVIDGLRGLFSRLRRRRHTGGQEQ